MDQVLYLTEPLDELMVQSIDEFASYRLVDAAKGNLDIPEIEDDEEKTEEAKKDLEEVGLPFPSFSCFFFCFLGELVTLVERLVLPPLLW